MFIKKTRIKDIVKVLFGFNIICLGSFLLLDFFKVIPLSKSNLFYLSIFTLLFICTFMREKYYDKKESYYFYTTVLIGDLLYVMQVSFQLGRNFIKLNGIH